MYRDESLSVWGPAGDMELDDSAYMNLSCGASRQAGELSEVSRIRVLLEIAQWVRALFLFTAF